MSSRFDVCLLLYVIRLAGWLKHCNLSLSHVIMTRRKSCHTVGDLKLDTGYETLFSRVFFYA